MPDGCAKTSERQMNVATQRRIVPTEHDRFIYEKEIRPFIPDRIFDAHSHLLFNEFHPHLAQTMPLASDPLLGNVDLPWLQEWWSALFPGSAVRGMIMGFPTADVEEAGENAAVAASAHTANLPFALLVRPEASPDDLEADIQRWRPAVLKPYLTFVKNTDPANARITDLIPEPLIELADRHRLVIMLHVSKSRGMADTENLSDIARLVRSYPNCQFNLAHCGRCFIAPNMDDALDRLPVAENLWLDTSAVCDLGVFMALLSKYERSRILFGTDLVTAAAFRGSYVRLGMGWHLCTADMVSRPGHNDIRSTFAAYESTASLCRAMTHCSLREEERFAIFYKNAEAIYGDVV